MTDQPNTPPHGRPHMPRLEPLVAPEPEPARPAGPVRTQQERAAIAARRQRLGKIAGGALALVGTVVGASFAWSELRPITPPDMFHDPFEDVLGFALLDRNFNKLPIEERLRLLKELADRLRSMNSGDSALMAAFAAGITGKARAQLEANVRTLMMDVMDKFAAMYAKASPDQREAALKDSLIQMIDMMREFDPTDDGKDKRSAEDQLAEMKKRSQERAERMRGQGDASIGEGEVSRMFSWVQNDVNRYSSPNERARVTRFMRDTVRYLRGNDVATGKPKPAP